MKHETLSAGQIKQIRKEIQGYREDPRDQVIDSHEFQRRFGIVRRTAYTWRKKGLLPYLLIGNRVFYRLSDIREFLENQLRRYEK